MDEEFLVDRAVRGASARGIGAENTFSGVLSMFRRPYRTEPGGADVAFTGIPYDLAVTNRPGTRLGPRAIRAASAHLAWPGGMWPWSFDPFEQLEVVDAGDLAVEFGRPDTIGEQIRAHAAALIAADTTLISLGGDHFVTYGLLKAHTERHGPLSLIQFDAHSDTWREESKRIDHGTMFFHAVEEGLIDAARSVQVGIRSGNPETHGLTVIDADRVHERPLAETIAEIRAVVAGGPAYLSFDIDCLDPAHAPGTGTPVCGGLTTHQARKLLAGLTGLDIVGMDLVEVSPPFDHAEITALAAATLVLDMVALQAIRRRQPVRS
ncbi:MAG: agmatinase [Rhizobiales bacterium]|nr:agmatinase [Hyphomicrobiales bacterium]